MADLSVKPNPNTPDISLLAAWPASNWRAFGERLRHIGLNAASLAPLADVAPGQLPRLVNPLCCWLLSKQDEPFSHAARLLLLKGSISRDQAISAFGEMLFEKMLDVGIVQSSDDLLSTPFHMTILKDNYILADDLRHGADAVMGSGNTTAGLIEAAYPKRRLKRVLDLCCGAGAMALALAACAESVIATDINPRALVFGRINAAINGIENVEFREGDLCAPVAGELFDLIVSQPPFIPMPEGSAPTTYLFGGSRGDELPTRVLADASLHLTNDGRAVLLIQWPEIEGESILERVRTAAPSSDTDVLLIVYPAVSLDWFAINYSSYAQAELGKQYEHEVIRWRDHFANLRMRSMRHCFNVLRKKENHQGWTHAIYPTTPAATSEGIDTLLRRYDLLAAGKETILRSRLRVPRGAFTINKNPWDKEGNGEILVGFDDRMIGRPVAINREMQRLLKAVHRSKTVAQAIRTYAATEGWNENAAPQEFLPEVQNALELGLLEVVKAGKSRRERSAADGS